MDAANYRLLLRQALRPIEDIENACCLMDLIPQSLFNESVKSVTEFIESDYKGESYALYKFKDKYFYIRTSFGSCSGCDEWADASFEKHTNTIDRIIDGIEPFDNIWEIPMNDYVHPTWKNMIIDILDEDNTLDKFHKHQSKIWGE